MRGNVPQVLLLSLLALSLDAQHIGIRVNNNPSSPPSSPHNDQGISLTPQKHTISLNNLAPKPTAPVHQDLSRVAIHMNGNRLSNSGPVSFIGGHLQPDVSPEKVKKLRRILAGKLDREWTSDTKPRIIRQRGVSGGATSMAGEPDPELAKAAQSLNITLLDQSGNGYLMSEAQINLFRDWMVRKATCEMEFIWEDLGMLFWPRWIRRGVCLNQGETVCSWPPGMKCRPSGSRALQLLHWKCESSSSSMAEGTRLRRTPRSVSASAPALHRFHQQQQQQRRARLQPRWSQQTHQRRNRRTWNRGAPLTDDQREELRQRRARRLIRQLSVNENGQHCFWQPQKYLISDRCTCSCA